MPATQAKKRFDSLMMDTKLGHLPLKPRDSQLADEWLWSQQHMLTPSSLQCDAAVNEPIRPAGCLGYSQTVTMVYIIPWFEMRMAGIPAEYRITTNMVFKLCDSCKLAWVGADSSWTKLYASRYKISYAKAVEMRQSNNPKQVIKDQTKPLIDIADATYTNLQKNTHIAELDIGLDNLPVPAGELVHVDSRQAKFGKIILSIWTGEKVQSKTGS